MTTTPSAASTTTPAAASVTGVWTSADGQLRLELRVDGTLIEDLNGRRAAYIGRYTFEGDTLTLYNDSGIPARGTIAANRIQRSGFEFQRSR